MEGDGARAVLAVFSSVFLIMSMVAAWLGSLRHEVLFIGLSIMFVLLLAVDLLLEVVERCSGR